MPAQSPHIPRLDGVVTGELPLQLKVQIDVVRRLVVVVLAGQANTTGFTSVGSVRLTAPKAFSIVAVVVDPGSCKGICEVFYEGELYVNWNG